MMKCNIGHIASLTHNILVIYGKCSEILIYYLFEIDFHAIVILHILFSPDFLDTHLLSPQLFLEFMSRRTQYINNGAINMGSFDSFPIRFSYWGEGYLHN